MNELKERLNEAGIGYKDLVSSVSIYDGDDKLSYIYKDENGYVVVPESLKQGRLYLTLDQVIDYIKGEISVHRYIKNEVDDPRYWLIEYLHQYIPELLILESQGGSFSTIRYHKNRPNSEVHKGDLVYDHGQFTFVEDGLMIRADQSMMEEFLKFLCKR